jgi:short-subunit dehydrogenase
MKSCLIIGASHGIGESLARKFHQEGFRLALIARSQDKLIALQKELAGDVLIESVDVVDFENLNLAIKNFAQKLEKIDFAIFCPALYAPMPAFDFDLEKAKEINQVNFVGFLNFLKAILPQMLLQKSGKIGAVASVAGYFGMKNSFAYGASKAAMINLCEGIYGELKEKNIAISVINPGFVESRLTAKNNFKMPFIISSERAAELIFQGLMQNKFEIHFPKKFTLILKFLQLLPYKILLFLTSKL